MAIRSMTAFAQVKGEVRPSELGQPTAGFMLTLKAVNHRFLDLHFRLPAESEALEIKLRNLLKQKLARGHVDVVLSLDAAGANGAGLNREIVGGYVRAFRAAADEFGIAGQPDLNVVLRLPGALVAAGAGQNGNLESAVLLAAEKAVASLDHMRAQEGVSIEKELCERMNKLRAAADEVEKLRGQIVRWQSEKMQARMQELLGTAADASRILQEAAMLAERSDVQEEVVRMRAHVEHFLGLLKGGGEAGKRLDFLLQEMNREANTMLSKTAGIAGEGLRLTELGLAMKSEIEKAREQVQNVE